MFLVIIYFSKMFQHKKSTVPYYIYYSGFIIMEIIIFIVMISLNNVHTPTRIGLNILISLFTLFALTFYYDAHIGHRLFVSISFQAFCNVSEIIVYMGFNFVFSFIGMQYYVSDYIYNFLSKIIVFLLITITLLITNRRKIGYTIPYGILIIMTPVISIITIIGLSYPASDNTNYKIIQFTGIMGLTFFNIANFYLLENIIRSKELAYNEKALAKQIDYQSEKYDMIKTAYRDTRRLIHDTKSHYYFIRSALEKNEYDILPDYINTQIDELETNRILVNSGNLVIDSLVSNYIMLARQDNIIFDTKIRIAPEHIPIVNYDLCIIIGNLLENALKAVREIDSKDTRHILFEAYTSSKELVIHISNTIASSDHVNDTDLDNVLNHGFGMENINKVVTQYTGIYNYFIENDEYNAIVIIPNISL